MKDEKKDSLFRLIGVPVIVALLAGGTAPWWVNHFFQREPQSDTPKDQNSGNPNNDLGVNGTYRPIHASRGISEADLRVAESALGYIPNDNYNTGEEGNMTLKLLADDTFSFEVKEQNISTNSYIITQARDSYRTADFINTSLGIEVTPEEKRNFEDYGFILDKTFVVDMIPSSVTSEGEEVQDFPDLQAMLYHHKDHGNFMLLLGGPLCILKNIL